MSGSGSADAVSTATRYLDRDGKQKHMGVKLYPRDLYAKLRIKARKYENHFRIVQEEPSMAVVLECKTCAAKISCANPSASTRDHISHCGSRRIEFCEEDSDVVVP